MFRATQTRTARTAATHISRAKESDPVAPPVRVSVFQKRLNDFAVGQSPAYRRLGVLRRRPGDPGRDGPGEVPQE